MSADEQKAYSAAGAESGDMFDAKDFMEDAIRYNWYVVNSGRSPVPSPDSCAACGCEGDRNHAFSWVVREDGTAGFHHYEAPSNELRLLRMKARRTLKLG